MQILAAPFVLSYYLLAYFSSKALADDKVSRCVCGYLDSSTQSRYTESSIVYFNETATLATTGYVAESYSHPYDKGWNTQYREGAAVSNVALSNSISPAESRYLEMIVQPP